MPLRRSLVADVAGDGPAVVLLHGQPGRAGDWDRVTARLAGRYRIVAPDRLGYGRTGGAAGDFAANAAATVDLMDELGIARAVVGAHSWAGGVAMCLALDAPERVSGLVLVGSVAPGEPVGRLDRALAVRPLGELVALATLGIAGRALSVQALRRAVSQVLPDGAARVVVRSGPARHTWRSFAVEQRVYVAQLDDLAARLGAIRAPTQVVVGAADKVVGAGAGGVLAAAIPGAVLTTVPRAGHLLPWDHPEAVEDAVDAVAAVAG